MGQILCNVLGFNRKTLEGYTKAAETDCLDWQVTRVVAPIAQLGFDSSQGASAGSLGGQGQ